MALRTLLLCVCGSMLAIMQSQALVPLDSETARTTVGGLMCFQGAVKDCPEPPRIPGCQGTSVGGTPYWSNLVLLPVAYCKTVSQGFRDCEKIYYPVAYCYRCYFYPWARGGCTGDWSWWSDYDPRWASGVIENGICPAKGRSGS